MNVYLKVVAISALMVGAGTLFSKPVTFTLKGPILQGQGYVRAFAVPFSSVEISEAEAQKAYNQFIENDSTSSEGIKLTFDDAYVRSIEMDRVWIGQDKFKHGASTLQPYAFETASKGLFSLKSIENNSTLCLECVNNKIVKIKQ